jgi:hypothetical protein
MTSPVISTSVATKGRRCVRRINTNGRSKNSSIERIGVPKKDDDHQDGRDRQGNQKVISTLKVLRHVRVTD